MGGLNSGRKRLHTCIDDCLEIDTTWLKRKRLLQCTQPFSIAWSKWKETNFREKTKQEYKMRGRISLVEHPTLTLEYQTARTVDDCLVEEHTHKHTIPLVSTSCNYGGKRWWFTAPCCQRRVRVLYINTKSQCDIDQVAPMCRGCQELHYASQCASYIERHVSYEKHLLRNYGYFWASYEYHALKKHYFEVTPEYQEIAMRSQLDREIEITNLFISTQRFLANMKLRQLKYALKTGHISDTDKAALFHYATDLESVSMLKLGHAIERGIKESNLAQCLPGIPASIDTLNEIDKIAEVVSDEDLLAATRAGLASGTNELLAKRDRLKTELKHLAA